MKLLHTPLKSAILALGIFAVSASAHASTLFDFSYKFLTGDTVTGSFLGNAQGNLITNLSNIMVNIDGTPLRGSGHLFDYHYNDTWGHGWELGGGVASFNGLQNNFNFVDGNDFRHDTWTNWFISTNAHDEFGVMTATTTAVSSSGQFFGDADAGFVAANWHVRAASAVPEPSSYALLLGGLGLIYAVRRRQAK